MWRDDTADLMRWSLAGAVVLALHAAVVVLLMHHTVFPPVVPSAPEAVMLDLAPELPPLQDATPAQPVHAVLPPVAVPLAAPPPVSVPMPPGVLPPELPDLPPIPPVATAAVPPTPPPPRIQPRPKPPLHPRPVERTLAAPASTELVRPTEQQATAPVGPGPSISRPAASASKALPNWRVALLGRLQAAKRYPDQARSQGDQGVATVRFTMDRAGRVLGVSLVRSAGSPLLDEEAVALVRRAEPLPPLPDEFVGATATLTVPISFALR